jgi:hypothetical protein
MIDSSGACLYDFNNRIFEGFAHTQAGWHETG